MLGKAGVHQPEPRRSVVPLQARSRATERSSHLSGRVPSLLVRELDRLDAYFAKVQAEDRKPKKNDKSENTKYQKRRRKNADNRNANRRLPDAVCTARTRLSHVHGRGTHLQLVGLRGFTTNTQQMDVRPGAMRIHSMITLMASSNPTRYASSRFCAMVSLPTMKN